MFQLNIDGGAQADTNKIYDLVVVGAGAAGLTSAIYASRDGWDTLVLEKEASGGLAATTHLIENYPGFPEGIDGSELMEKFAEQAKRFGAQIVEFEEVTSLKKNDDGIFEIATSGGAVYKGRTVILATGSRPKKLGIPGEEEFANKGVSYCATCDGPLFKDQDVVVIGCGNSGLQEAQILLEYAKSVTFVEFLPYSIAEKVLQDRVVNHPKVKCYFSHMAVEIKGDDFVHTVVVKDRESGEIKEIPAKGVFIYVGYQPYTDFVKGFVELDERGYIITDNHMRTNVDGVFAAGDVRSGNLAQVAVAVGDGAKAAIGVREYLQAQNK
ncbi:MAG: thioredoxin-disulfide reductase [Chloroflexi bacterium]|nr:thioredoxin-disulfide reductase [Chloroflexota bacterium]